MGLCNQHYLQWIHKYSGPAHPEEVLAKMWREESPHALLVKVQMDATTIEISIEVPHKIINISTI